VVVEEEGEVLVLEQVRQLVELEVVVMGKHPQQLVILELLILAVAVALVEMMLAEEVLVVVAVPVSSSLLIQ
jgi:hypothetical protein